MTHAHRHRRDPGLGPAPRGVRIILTAVLVPLIAATILGLVVLWPSGDEVKAGDLAVQRAHATVLATHPCRHGVSHCLSASVDLTSGPGAPGRAEATLPFGRQAPPFEVGDQITLGYVAQAPVDQRYQFIDFDRTQPLMLLLGIFIAGVLMLSRWRGIGSLASLAFSLLLITLFAVPALLEGSPPLAVAIVTASTIMIVALYLSHGFNARTSVAMLGTLLALVVTSVLGSIFTRIGKFTGLKEEESQFIGAVANQVDLRGLFLAGLVIGALGVLDDVTVTQASAVWELADADPQASRASLFARGMRVGRAHVASTINTLVLAYVGATLPLLLVFTVIDVPIGVAVSQELVAQEVVRGLVGGLGIMTAVPITTAIAALIAGLLATRRNPSPA
ncbi:MAG: YibE/F family protein [Streptomycetales bacterium]